MFQNVSEISHTNEVVFLIEQKLLPFDIPLVAQQTDPINVSQHMCPEKSIKHLFCADTCTKEG